MGHSKEWNVKDVSTLLLSEGIRLNSREMEE